MACEGDRPPYADVWQSSTSRVTTPTIQTATVDGAPTVTKQRPHLMDAHGRYLHIRGINVSGSHKAPPTEFHELGTRPSRYPLTDPSSERCRTVTPIPDDCLPKGPDGEVCTRTDSCPVSYIASPFPLEDADRWFGELAGLGFNSVRLITNWESIQPYRPGSEICRTSERYTDECYDLEYLDYYEGIIRKAKDHGIYVLVDMHQDIFSRHLMTYYNEEPSYLIGDEIFYPEPGSIEHLIMSLFPKLPTDSSGQTTQPAFSDWVRGHGAPRWVVQMCLPEKQMDSPYWGFFRGVGMLTKADGGPNAQLLGDVQALLERFSDGDPIPPWLSDLVLNRTERSFEVNETSDVLPLSPWVVSGILSLDIDRCFAALFAGDVVYPDLVVDANYRTAPREQVKETQTMGNLRDVMQKVYADAFIQVVRRAKKYDHIIGYDVMNEPVGVFLMMTIGGLFKDLAPEPTQCDIPVDCALPENCRPGSADWPGCSAGILEEIDEGLSDADRVAAYQQAYEALRDEAPKTWSCVDADGLDAIGGAADSERWCRRLKFGTKADNLLKVNEEPIEELVKNIAGDELGGELFAIVSGLNLLPTDAHPNTLRRWGLEHIDTGAAAGMNIGFEEKYLQPFFERIGQAIQAEDPNAIIWFEPATSIRLLTGPMRFWDQPLAKPKGIKQLVYAPHWYPDIYPNLGINSPPRTFAEDEWLYRDFTESLEEHLNEAPTWLGNIPVVFGEFGTYFNFLVDGEEVTSDTRNQISAHVINSYYESFEHLGLGSMIWCFSAHNSAEYGESWNHEDFSIIGPDQQPRAWGAYVRTYARALSGKLIQQHFNSQYHFWDPSHGEAPPERVYELEMARRESDAPTEIFVSKKVYPDGFYVWLSDGVSYYDAQRQILYWYPSADEKGIGHQIRIEPHLDDREYIGWSYFYKNGSTLVGIGDATLTGGRRQ